MTAPCRCVASRPASVLNCPKHHGFAERWNANAARYADDVCLFLEDQWVVRDVPPNMELGPDNTIRLMPWQRTILGEFTRRHPNGRPVYKLRIYSVRKKSGKTEIEGGSAEHTTLTEAGTPELYFIGNDKEQAQTRAFAAIGTQIDPESKAYNPVVGSFFRFPPRGITRSTDLLQVRGGGFLKSIPVDFAGEAGANPLGSYWDELWGVDRETQRRLWDEFTPPPTRANGHRFVATYAGFRNESELLYDLYERIVGGDRSSERKKRRIHPDIPLYVSKSGDEIAYWEEGIESRRMPWQTDEYYRSEKAANRPSMYTRIHENRWTDNETNFILEEQWNALPRYDRMVRNAERYPCYAAVDAAHKRDTTTGVVIEYLPILSASGRHFKRVVDKQTWRPTNGKVVIPEDTALPWLRSCLASYNIKAVGYDPAHFETPAARLREEYPHVDIREMTNSVANLTRQGSALYDDIVYEILIVYDEPEGDPDSLKHHVINAVATETPVGWKLSKGRDTKKIDGAAALSMASVLANERGARDLEASTPMYFSGLDDENGDEY